jgi:radical SAM protein
MESRPADRPETKSRCGETTAPPNPDAIDTGERPFVLVWECTQACELACKHCRADAEEQRHPDELTTVEAKALLDDARRFGEGQIVVLSGGDPLVREDLLEIVTYGKDRGLRMTLTPSGTSSLTDERVGALEDAGLRRIALSLDGASPSAHDEFRQETGSFEETVRAARQAEDIGLPLQINTTVCRETVGELRAIRDLVAELGAVLWSVFFLVPIGRGRVLKPINPQQAETVMSWLCEVSETAPFGVKTTEAPHYRRVALQAKDDGTRTTSTKDGTSSSSGCSDGPPDHIGRRDGITAGDGFAFVSHVGQIYPSGFLPDSAGNVREESVVDVYRNAPTFKTLRDPDALNGKCGACEFRHVCGGSRSRAFAYTGDPLAADPLCSYRPPSYDGTMPTQSFETVSDSLVNP